MKANLVKYTYFIVLTADILIRLLEFNEFDKFLKPLLMPLMLYYLIERAAGKIYRSHLLLALALIVSWIGDILLLYKEQVFLMGGIGVFLITQSTYMIIFRSNITVSLRQSIFDNKVATGIITLFLVAMLISAIYFIDFPLMILVAIYAAGVAGATLTAYLQNRNIPGYLLTTVGMSCFLISDTLIGVNLFVAPVPLAPLLIMGTYGIAQYLITEGVVLNSESDTGI